MLWLAAGVLVGIGFQIFLDGPATSGLKVIDAPNESGATVSAFTGKKSRSDIRVGDVIVAITTHRGEDSEEVLPITKASDYEDAVTRASNGDVVWHQLLNKKRPQPVNLQLAPSSPRAMWIRPFAFAADLFLRLLKMLIVPIILTSIVTGVVGVGAGRDLRRMGVKTFAYYIGTSLLAIITALALVNIIRPGDGAKLGLRYESGFEKYEDASFVEVILRMVPENIFAGLSSNLNMLQVIFFSLLFGYFILRVRDPHKSTLIGVFAAAFEVMMKMAEFILSLIPYGVFCLLVKVVGTTGFGVFRPLGVYMLTVTAALLVHSLISLPLVLRFVAKVNPWTWIKAMSPALLTAFSTSSSSMTLPVSMETVEKKGGVSNRVTSFVQPLGATINMDGTALYECLGVVFLAQYYAATGGGFELTMKVQIITVVMALMASIGAAGIPSAGLIMMLTILSALNLPVEGAALLLAVDRPLDMLRTVVNVFSDTCGSAVVARSEGESPLGESG